MFHFLLVLSVTKWTIHPHVHKSVNHILSLKSSASLSSLENSQNSTLVCILQNVPGCSRTSWYLTYYVLGHTGTVLWVLKRSSGEDSP